MSSLSQIVATKIREKRKQRWGNAGRVGRIAGVHRAANSTLRKRHLPDADLYAQRLGNTVQSAD